MAQRPIAPERVAVVSKKASPPQLPGTQRSQFPGRKGRLVDLVSTVLCCLAADGCLQGISPATVGRDFNPVAPSGNSGITIAVVDDVHIGRPCHLSAAVDHAEARHNRPRPRPPPRPPLALDRENTGALNGSHSCRTLADQRTRLSLREEDPVSSETRCPAETTPGLSACPSSATDNEMGPRLRRRPVTKDRG